MAVHVHARTPSRLELRDGHLLIRFTGWFCVLFGWAIVVIALCLCVTKPEKALGALCMAPSGPIAILFGHVMAAVPTGVYVFDGDARIVTWERGKARLTYAFARVAAAERVIATEDTGESVVTTHEVFLTLTDGSKVPLNVIDWRSMNTKRQIDHVVAVINKFLTSHAAGNVSPPTAVVARPG